MEEDKQQWLSIAAVVLVIAGLGYFLFRQSQQVETPEVNSAEVIAEQKAEELLEQMNFEVPETAVRATLRDVEGGSGAGVATKIDDDGNQTFSVLVALPEPSTGVTYEAYLVGEGEGNEVYLGKLREAKGGWILDYESKADLSEYTKVRVTREEVDDRVSEEVILEGEFRE